MYKIFYMIIINIIRLKLLKLQKNHFKVKKIFNKKLIEYKKYIERIF